MKILVAEDDPVSRRLLEATLVKWGYEVIVTRDGLEAWEALQSDDCPRLAILDWMMPGVDGVEICRKVREQITEPYVYILLLTARKQRQDLLDGMEAGADDYITKPFDHNELKVRLRAGRRLLELQADLIAAREALRDQATHDALTGLWNRTAVFDILKSELARVRRVSPPLSIVMADLDGFKQLNDTYGHMAGDAVLREATRRMLSSVRSYDSLGRYGGEEFLVVLPGCDLEDGARQAERLRASIAAEVFLVPETVSVTCSFGVASTDGAPSPDFDTLVRAADSALYRAKRNGRNRVELVHWPVAEPVPVSS